MSRIEILKTYKIFVGGKLLRTESGRYFHVKNSKGDLLANMCLSSRKDIRDAVLVARNAQEDWANLTALNRGQILYRIAEMLEDRKSQFTDQLQSTGSSLSAAKKEVDNSIDRLIYYAGWSDKFHQIFSTVNPVASNHFNFSTLEPVGVVSIIAPTEDPLLSIISLLAPVIVGGNTALILASSVNPLVAISLAEVINTSDVPSGVVNILTGDKEELLPHFSSHNDVNAIIYCGDDLKDIEKVEEMATGNLKRVSIYKRRNWSDKEGQSPYFIEKYQEIKTIWHPTEV